MKTLINMTSNSLGDNIAFSAYADVYQKKYGGKVFFKSKWSDIFCSTNPDVNFVNLDYEDSFDTIKNVDFIFKNCPIQKIACDALNLDYEEIIPQIKLSDKYNFNKKKKYVCISVQSTAQMKYWNHNNGWKKVVRYLKDLNYDVYVIDKYDNFGINGHYNKIPEKAFNETGDYPIEYRIQQLKNCSFFIGLSSGLSWLAWALNKKVVMISGCTNENNEFKNNCYRVINKNVCHGCLNDESIMNNSKLLLESKGWLYCPHDKNFECTKTISFEMVKEKIDQCIKDLNS